MGFKVIRATLSEVSYQRLQACAFWNLAVFSPFLNLNKKMRAFFLFIYISPYALEQVVLYVISYFLFHHIPYVITSFLRYLI